MFFCITHILNSLLSTEARSDHQNKCQTNIAKQERRNCVAITFSTLNILNKLKQNYSLQLIHKFLLESVSLLVLTQSQGTPFFSFLCLSFTTHSCPVECMLHPNTISMVTHILYVDQPLRCASVCLFFYVSSLPKQPLNRDKV